MFNPRLTLVFFALPHQALGSPSETALCATTPPTPPNTHFVRPSQLQPSLSAGFRDMYFYMYIYIYMCMYLFIYLYIGMNALQKHAEPKARPWPTFELLPPHAPPGIK